MVHDLLAAEPRAQVELQKTATGFDIPGLTTVGAHGLNKHLAAFAICSSNAPRFVLQSKLLTGRYRMRQSIALAVWGMLGPDLARLST